MDRDIIDIEEILKKWANSFPLERDQKRLVADEILASDINWKHFKVSHEDAKYNDESQASVPKSHVLFAAMFTNNTDQDQVYNLKTERKTRSTCTLTVNRGHKFGYNVDIKLEPPNPIISANAGFKKEFELSKASGETFEEELTWAVDSQIKVPPKYKTKAELVIQEDEYSGKFSVKSKFSGKIHISLRNKKDNNILTTINGDVRQIFTPDQGFIVNQLGVYSITEGVCHCRYGIQQHLNLNQEPLEE